MKPNIIIIICLLLLIIVLITCAILTKHKKDNISNIKEMRFSYSTGTAINANVFYEIKCHNNSCLATIKPSDIPEEECAETKINKTTIVEIENILNKYEVSKWNNYDKSDKNVLDGNSFSIYITMENDKSITAHGYMKWPKNYNEVKSELDIIFNKIYNNQ